MNETLLGLGIGAFVLGYLVPYFQRHFLYLHELSHAAAYRLLGYDYRITVNWSNGAYIGACTIYPHERAADVHPLEAKFVAAAPLVYVFPPTVVAEIVAGGWIVSAVAFVSCWLLGPSLSDWRTIFASDVVDPIEPLLEPRDRHRAAEGIDLAGGR